MKRSGLRVGHGVDLRCMSYGQRWDVSDVEARGRLIWLVRDVLRPRACHVATPCQAWSCMGQHRPREESQTLMTLTIELLLHQEVCGLLGSFEAPLGKVRRSVSRNGFLRSEVWSHLGHRGGILVSIGVCSTRFPQGWMVCSLKRQCGSRSGSSQTFPQARWACVAERPCRTPLSRACWKRTR